MKTAESSSPPKLAPAPAWSTAPDTSNADALTAGARRWKIYQDLDTWKTEWRVESMAIPEEVDRKRQCTHTHAPPMIPLPDDMSAVDDAVTEEAMLFIVLCTHTT